MSYGKIAAEHRPIGPRPADPYVGSHAARVFLPFAAAPRVLFVSLPRRSPLAPRFSRVCRDGAFRDVAIEYAAFAAFTHRSPDPLLFEIFTFFAGRHRPHRPAIARRAPASLDPVSGAACGRFARNAALPRTRSAFLFFIEFSAYYALNLLFNPIFKFLLFDDFWRECVFSHFPPRLLLSELKNPLRHYLDH